MEGGMSAKLLLQLYHCATRRVPVLCCQVLNRETKHKKMLDTTGTIRLNLYSTFLHFFNFSGSANIQKVLMYFVMHYLSNLRVN